MKFRDDQDAEKFHKFWSKYADEIVFKKAFAKWNTYENDPHPELTDPCGYPWERMMIWFDGKVNPVTLTTKVCFHMEM